MKKLASTSLSALALSALAFSAQAEPVKFAGIAFGSTVTQIESENAFGSAKDDTDPSSTYTASFGIKDRTFRLYAEGSFENNEFANTSMITFNADYIYAIPAHNKASLFAGASLGHATMQWDEDNVDVKKAGLDGESDDSFVYGAKVGAKYLVIPKAEVELGFRQIYSSLKSNETTGSFSAEESAMTYVGMTYAF